MSCYFRCAGSDRRRDREIDEHIALCVAATEAFQVGHGFEHPFPGAGVAAEPVCANGVTHHRHDRAGRLRAFGKSCRDVPLKTRKRVGVSHGGVRHGEVGIDEGHAGFGEAPCGELGNLASIQGAERVTCDGCAGHEGCGVDEGEHGQRAGSRWPDSVAIDREGALDMAPLQCEECAMPGKVSVQHGRAVVAR